MSIIVQKFGGTSVGDIERIKHVATLVKREIDLGHQVVVVVSAMSGKTNELVGWAEQLSTLSTKEALKEYDSLVSSGEQVTSGLLALALQSMGIKARSWLGWQLGFMTDKAHGKARIGDIKVDKIKKSLDKGRVAVVAGFQGVTLERRITTLGRGGSDTSAVALAAALDAERCDIYTDVDGIYTTDPRLVPKARKLQKVAYEEMLEMASLGAKVLQTRSVEMAMKYNVRVQVLSSFSDVAGSLLVGEEEVVERRLVTGVTYSRNEAQITLTKVPNIPGLAAEVFAPLTDRDINVDMIVQNVSEEGKTTDITFTVSKSDAANAVATLEAIKDKLKYKSILVDKAVAKVSVIGVGMRSHAGLAQKMFQTLADKNINILVISTSEIKISVLIAEEYTELALRALHTAYGLDKDEEK
jgi:aspartate kinase